MGSQVPAEGREPYLGLVTDLSALPSSLGVPGVVRGWGESIAAPCRVGRSSSFLGVGLAVSEDRARRERPRAEQSRAAKISAWNLP